MNVVDSSGWLEYFADGANADFFAPPIQKVTELVVPTISLYEVFRRVHQQRGEDSALHAVATMLQGSVADLDTAMALDAARLSLDQSLPMADSIILTVARAYGATLWTQHADFGRVEGVRYVEKR